MNWVPYVRENKTFKREYNNKHDRFIVTGKTLLKGHIAPISVVPRELSQQTWYVIQEGAHFEATAHNTKVRLSPLVQGGHEIPIRIKVV